MLAQVLRHLPFFAWYGSSGVEAHFAAMVGRFFEGLPMERIAGCGGVARGSDFCGAATCLSWKAVRFSWSPSCSVGVAGSRFARASGQGQWDSRSSCLRRSPLCRSLWHRRRGLRRWLRRQGQPTVPSSETESSFCASTANSMGSLLSTSFA